MRSVYRVQEHAPLRLPIALVYRDGHVDLYDEVESRGYLKAHLSGGEICFTAGNYIGLIPLNDRVAIDVIPRVDVGELNRILAVSHHQPVTVERAIRGYATADTSLESLLDIVATSYLSTLDVVAHRGLHGTYVERIEDTSFPRGRIRMSGTIRHASRGSLQRVQASWFEGSIDTQVNRLIKHALRCLARQYEATQRRAGQRKIITGINQIYHILEDVTLDQDRSYLTNPIVQDPTLLPWDRTYYAPALHLARLIVENETISVDQGGPIRLPSLLINMEDAFEDYIRAILQSKLNSSTLKVLDGNVAPPIGARKPLYSDSASPPAQPDIVVRRADQTAPLVAEVKYRPGGPTRDDINQLTTYAASYSSTYAVVISPSDADRSECTKLGELGGFTLYHCTIALSGDLERNERSLACSIRALVTAGPANRSLKSTTVS